MLAAELPADLNRCIAFHGHLCPGLVIGYCASRLALERLSADRAEDEELIAIVENDTCAVDAVQVLTGCTFGKGNLFFRDYGKMAFTFALRDSGRSIRLSFNQAAPPDIENIPEPLRRDEQVKFMLAGEPAELFAIETDPLDRLPATARIHESATCDACGERTMAERLREVGGRRLCIPCAQHES